MTSMIAISGKYEATPMKEVQLAEFYLRGDRTVYKQVDRWINQVTTLSVWHFVGQIEDTNSVIHLKLFSSLKAQNFRGDSTFRTYVQRIARYTCIDQVRSQRVEREIDPADLPTPAAEARPDELHERSVERQIFLKIFRAIGPECQGLWRLVFSDSLNYKEIGVKLNLPEGTVKRKVHECKQRAIELKEKLI
jgi:RNA polymerase sigma factor (sigma-70 family)